MKKIPLDSRIIIEMPIIKMAEKMYETHIV